MRYKDESTPHQWTIKIMFKNSTETFSQIKEDSTLRATEAEVKQHCKNLFNLNREKLKTVRYHKTRHPGAFKDIGEKQTEW